MASVACLLVTAGCAHAGGGNTAQTRELADAGFAAFECGRGADGGDADPLDAERHARAAALVLARDVDYMRLSWRRDANDAIVFAERGKGCAGATDSDACLERLHALDGTDCADAGCPAGLEVLTTLGDLVSMQRGRAEVLALLGSIDRPEEAWLALMAAGHAGPYACGDAQSSAQRVVPGGYELRVRSYTRTCRPLERTEQIFIVDAEGRVSAGLRKILQSDAEACVVP